MSNCRGCGLPKPIQNKKYELCSECVFKKTHNGKTQAEVYAERSRDRELKKQVTPLKVKPSLKKKKSQTSQQIRQSEISKELTSLKNLIRQEALENEQYFCEGCGAQNVRLDCSHIISVKQRKDLELVRENIQLLCRSCHIIWESWDISKMINLYCFESNLMFAKNNSRITYNKLQVRLEEYKKDENICS